MIVRIMGEGQYRLAPDAVDELNRLDTDAAAAVEAGDEQRLADLLGRMAGLVRSRGTRLDDADLSASDGIVPPTDLTLDEARELFSGEGLIPDLPA
jgi:hypothetical protein